MALLVRCTRSLSRSLPARSSFRRYSELAYPLQLASVSKQHAAICEESLRNPERFWGDQARRRVRWLKDFENVMSCDMKNAKFSWFDGGTLNVSGEKQSWRVGVAHKVSTYASRRQLLGSPCWAGSKQSCSHLGKRRTETTRERHIQVSLTLLQQVIWIHHAGCHVRRQLAEMTCQLANALKAQGVKRGDRVVIYLPNSPMAVASMLACARIGAIHG